MKLAKADIVPTDTNLADEYAEFRRPGGGVRRVHDDGERPGPPHDQAGPGGHAGTGTAPAAPGAGGPAHDHVRGNPHGRGEHPDGVLPGWLLLGADRLLGETVWVRVHGAGRDERVVIVHVGDRGAVEVARHARAEPGSPRLDDDHFPPAPAGALHREPKAGTDAEAAFLTLGDGAALWLKRPPRTAAHGSG